MYVLFLQPRTLVFYCHYLTIKVRYLIHCFNQIRNILLIFSQIGVLNEDYIHCSQRTQKGEAITTDWAHNGVKYFSEVVLSFSWSCIFCRKIFLKIWLGMKLVENLGWKSKCMKISIQFIRCLPPILNSESTIEIPFFCLVFFN